MLKTKGMTLIGMLLTMIVVIMLAIFFIRIIPVYIEYYEVTSSLRALNTLAPSEFTNDTLTNAHVLQDRFLNQLEVNSIENITPDEIAITPDGENQFRISVKYQVIRPFVGNIRLLFDFNATQEVKVSAE